MTLSQVSDYVPGMVPNRASAHRRNAIKSKLYPDATQIATLTIGGTATDGVYSADINGTTFSYTADTGGGDTNTTIAAGLLAAAQSNALGILDDVYVSLSGLVLTFSERIPGSGFTLDNKVAPAPGTLTIATVDDGVDSDLPLGIGVVLVAADPSGIRIPAANDTKIYGVVTAEGMIRPNEGSVSINDGYEAGSPVGVLRGHEECVVQTEEQLTVGDAVYCRNVVSGSLQLGAFRNDDGGVSQVTRGDVEFNATDQVGLIVDSLPTLAVASNTSDDQTATDLRDAWNASAQHAAVAAASIDTSGAESYIILTFSDYAAHTVTAYSPATADITSITNTTTAVAAQAILVPGEVTQVISSTVAIVDFNLPA